MWWKLVDNAPFEIGYDPDKKSSFFMMCADAPANDDVSQVAV